MIVQKQKFLLNGLRNGFSLGYDGDKMVKQKAPNLKLECGSKLDLWNKIMKEVGLKRFAGPFKQVPFKHYIQSPLGLVPKGESGVKLIFHLSYPKGS